MTVLDSTGYKSQQKTAEDSRGQQRTAGRKQMSQELPIQRHEDVDKATCTVLKRIIKIKVV